MHLGLKLIIALLITILLVLPLCLSGRSSADSLPTMAVRFVGYTNEHSGIRRACVFSIANTGASTAEWVPRASYFESADAPVGSVHGDPFLIGDTLPSASISQFLHPGQAASWVCADPQYREWRVHIRFRRADTSYQRLQRKLHSKLPRLIPSPARSGVHEAYSQWICK